MEPPFPADRQLCDELDGLVRPGSSVPGYPQALLLERSSLLAFMEAEYCSADLDHLAGKLWWMSKQDSANISPLHRQRVKGRNIILTEDPKLHLVWIQDRIFVKPLPRYLTSYAFWQNHLVKGADVSDYARAQRICKAALGYLRTYYYLVRSEVDFRMAQDPALRLLPENTTWEQFYGFIAPLARVADGQVSERYAYGEIRLKRLNFYAPLLLGKSNFQRVEYQSATYFARFYGPILFLIGLSSMILNGFQLAVGVEQANPTPHRGILLGVALWCSATAIVCFCALFAALFLVYVYRTIKEWKYAIGDRIRRLNEASSMATR